MVPACCLHNIWKLQVFKVQNIDVGNLFILLHETCLQNAKYNMFNIHVSSAAKPLELESYNVIFVIDGCISTTFLWRLASSPSTATQKITSCVWNVSKGRHSTLTATKALHGMIMCDVLFRKFEQVFKDYLVYEFTYKRITFQAPFAYYLVAIGPPTRHVRLRFSASAPLI